MKKVCALALVLLLSLPGCWGKRKKVEARPKNEVYKTVDIPVAGDSIDKQSFYDDQIGDFIDQDQLPSALDIDQLASDEPLSWKDLSKDTQFKTIYFDFDGDRIRADQKPSVTADIALIKQKLQNHESTGFASEILVVAEAHSCHSAGAEPYNIALSERRAKSIRDVLVAEGIPASMIKIVGRGSEIPAIINGTPVEGGREAQWPNRRCEIRVIYT